MHTWVVILDAQIQAQSMQQEVDYVLGASVYFNCRWWAIEDCVLIFVFTSPDYFTQPCGTEMKGFSKT